MTTSNAVLIATIVDHFVPGAEDDEWDDEWDDKSTAGYGEAESGDGNAMQRGGAHASMKLK